MSRPPIPRLLAVTNRFPDGRLDRDPLERLLGWARRLPADPRLGIQLREKALPRGTLERVAADLREAYAGTLLVNVATDEALRLWRRFPVDGVHLPAAGPSVAAARAVVGAGRLVGRSTHGTEEAVAALSEGADYVLLGPIGPTPGKSVFGPPLGLGVLRRTSAEAPAGARILAIGGIDVDDLGPLLEAGAYGVAAIRMAESVAAVERALRELPKVAVAPPR